MITEMHNFELIVLIDRVVVSKEQNLPPRKTQVPVRSVLWLRMYVYIYKEKTPKLPHLFIALIGENPRKKKGKKTSKKAMYRFEYRVLKYISNG